MADSWIEDVPGIHDLVVDSSGMVMPRTHVLRIGSGLQVTPKSGALLLTSESVAALPVEADNAEWILTGIPDGGGAAINLLGWGVNGPGTVTLNVPTQYYVQINAVTEYQFTATRFELGGNVLSQTEAASPAFTPSAGGGVWWVQNATPSRPVFRTDVTNLDYQLGPFEDINSSSSASNTLTTSNLGKFNTYSNAAATLLVQDDADLNLPIGTIVNGYYSGSGTLTIQQDAANTVTPTPNGKTLVVQQKGVFALRKIAFNTWIVYGALV
jgi:hypothetical protein